MITLNLTQDSVYELAEALRKVANDKDVKTINEKQVMVPRKYNDKFNYMLSKNLNILARIMAKFSEKASALLTEYYKEGAALQKEFADKDENGNPIADARGGVKVTVALDKFNEAGNALQKKYEKELNEVESLSREEHTVGLHSIKEEHVPDLTPHIHAILEKIIIRKE